MRSICVHYPMEDEPRIRGWLDAHAAPAAGGSWVFPKQDSNLYITLTSPPSLEEGYEPAEIDALAGQVGPTAGAVQVDVSGRIPGDDEVRAICAALLELSPRSRATDGYTCHLWTADEIASSALAKGHPFFDYNGWYAEYNRSRRE